MTEQELREKISDTLNATEISVELEKRDIYKFADALIAAEIGDVKETKFVSDHFFKLWEGALVALERAEHRAEVAEKAFDDLVDEMYENEIRPICDKAFFKQTRFEQAEKELKEKRKDE